MTDLDSVVAVLQGGRRDEVRELLAGLTPRERKAFGPTFRRWMTGGTSARVSRDREALAVIATADGARQAGVVAVSGWGLTDEFVEDAVDNLRLRMPDWLPAFVEVILGEDGRGNWRLARALVRAGLVPEPTNPEYFRGTVQGVPDFNMRSRVPLVDRIELDPGLIPDHLFGMLSTEGVGRLLTLHDGWRDRPSAPPFEKEAFPEGTWRVALRTLVDSGRLDRDRAFDVVLAASLRDWAAADLAWYVGMHDTLRPSLEEIAARQSTYVRMLTVEHGPSVKTAQRALGQLLPDERFRVEPFLDASRATLGREDKTSVLAQLRLIEKLSKRFPDAHTEDVVLVATEHSKAEVRDLADRMLARAGDHPTRSSTASPVLLPVTSEIRAQADPVEPVASADELADLFLGLLEVTDPLELERAIDGLLRLADDRPSSADLLLDRAQGAELYGADTRTAARVLTLAWLLPRRSFRDGEWLIPLGHSILPNETATPESFVGAIGRRLTAIAHAVRNGAQTSLALPTRADFTLDAEVLNARVRSARRFRPVLELELVVALLRVSPEQRGSVQLPRSLRGSAAVAAAQEALSPSWQRTLATCQLHSWEPEQRLAIFRAEGAREGHAADGILGRSTPERTVRLELAYGEYEPRFEDTLSLGAALLPHDHDVLAAHAHPYLHRDLRKDRACSVAVIDAVARARSVNGAPSSSALALALAAKDARARTAAQDAIVDLSRQGLLDGSELGRQISLLLADDLIVGTRVSRGLAESARASDAAVPPVLAALEEVMGALPGRRDAGAFLEVAADVADRVGRKVVLPPEFRELASGKSKSLAAKAARRLA